MKVTLLQKKRILKFITNKRLAIAAIVIFFLLVVGASTYAIYQQQSVSNSSTPVAENDSSQSKVTEATQSTSSASPTSGIVETTDKPSSTPAASQQNQLTRPDRSVPPPKPAPTPPSSTSTFTASRISSSYTHCSYGTLGYTLGGVDIYSNNPTTQSFTWQTELSNGSVLKSGTDTMPAGQTYWGSFPSTSSNPSMLGTIQNAHDGDRARLVITAPNYSAGGWSDPVPAGSNSACQG